METETPSPRRRPNPWLLVLLGIALVSLVAYWMWPTPVPAPPPQTAQRTRTGRSGTNEAISPDDLKVRLEALQAKREDPSDAERNPFRFKPPPAPPPPKPQPVQKVDPGPPPAPPPPVIPPIPLKFMGTIEGPGVKLAALTDCKGFTYSGREGEPIDGRYRLVRIQTESIVIEYLNGTGRSTIRKSGECGAVK